MADNFLEYHYDEYEKSKAEWLRKMRHLPKSSSVKRKIERPDDEAL